MHSAACIMQTDACTATAMHPDMQPNSTADPRCYIVKFANYHKALPKLLWTAGVQMHC